MPRRMREYPFPIRWISLFIKLCAKIVSSFLMRVHVKKWARFLVVSCTFSSRPKKSLVFAMFLFGICAFNIKCCSKIEHKILFKNCLNNNLFITIGFRFWTPLPIFAIDCLFHRRYYHIKKIVYDYLTINFFITFLYFQYELEFYSKRQRKVYT